ncbi:MAG: glycosyltransferase [Nitrososphaerales archaeon]
MAKKKKASNKTGTMPRLTHPDHERKQQELLLQSTAKNVQKRAEQIMSKATQAKVAVIFPTINEETTIKSCIETAMKSKYKPSIIVSDGHSSDKTRDVAKSSGATVVMPEVSLHPGKGAAMVTGMKAALNKNPDVIVFLDADLMNLTPEWIDLLIDPIKVEGYDMTRGWYLRAPSDASVTKLVAKPFLWTFFPEIWHYEQPLSGEVAGKAELWKRLLEMKPPVGWGIDVWFLIETAMAGYKIKEVFLGTKSHRSYLSYSTDVSKLAKMGEQVGLAIIQEAIKYHRIDNATQTRV